MFGACNKISDVIFRSSWFLGRTVSQFHRNGKHKFSSNCSLFPGAKAPFVVKPTIVLPESLVPISIYRVINNKGEVENGADEPNLKKELVIQMFQSMVLLNLMDEILYQSQRQGRISFYMTNFGEEASHIGSVAALEKNDLIYGQYREAGILLWRGFSLSDFIDQCYGNIDDVGRGKQMPVHYGSKNLNFVTISSPLATQIPQAVGAAYSFKKNEDDKRIVVCYFGEGAASEGDVHGAFNFASTLECPIIFFCRNNGFAISTPSNEQYKGDGIAGRGQAYGIATIRVDGTDIFAVYNAMKEAREYVLANNKPLIFEALTYRVGHHSTSDDSGSYRSNDEVEIWKTVEHPINKLKNYIKNKHWWSDDLEVEFVKSAKKEILTQITASEKKQKPNWKEMFEDVYHTMPNQLKNQLQQLEEHIKRNKEHYPLKNFK